MIMQILIAQEPILPENVQKRLIEGNDQYRAYVLQRTEDIGTAKYYYYIDSSGKKTHMYYEEFLNGRWVYREEIPDDAFVQFVAKVKCFDNYNNKQYMYIEN